MIRHIVFKIILFLCIIISTFYKSQKIIIRGIARDTTKDYRSVRIVVNDTLKKHMKLLKEMKGKRKKWREKNSYTKLLENIELYTNVDENGNYKIKAKLSDTLYFYSSRHFTQKYKVADIIKHTIKVELKPERCSYKVDCEQSKPTNYYIFVAKKISVHMQDDPYYCDIIPLSVEYKSVYRIEQQIYGHYPKDTITFSTYDHYGSPRFSKYNTVLLFVKESCGKLYHESDQYFDVYKTKDGRWASPGDPYKFDKDSKKKSIKAQYIEFDNSLKIDTLNNDPFRPNEQEYEPPYYKIKSRKAIPLMGTYVDDLVKLKMEVINERYKNFKLE